MLVESQSLASTIFQSQDDISGTFHLSLTMRTFKTDFKHLRTGIRVVKIKEVIMLINYFTFILENTEEKKKMKISK